MPNYSSSSSKLDELNLRSEEVQEILGTPPHWLIRWGMLGTFVFIILLAWSLYWVSFPETVGGEIRLTKEEPSIELIVDNSTYVAEILVTSDDPVVAGQTVLILDSDAKYADVHSLGSYLSVLEKENDSLLLHYKFPGDLVLGDLEENLFQFLEKQNEAKEEQSGRFNQMSSDDIRREIKQERRLIQLEKRRRTNLLNQLDLAIISFTRLDNMYKSGVGDFNELREAEGKKFQYESQIQELETKIKIKESRIRLLDQRLKNNATISEDSRVKALNELKDELESLQRAVQKWMRNYSLISPIDGIVILDEIKENNYVQAGERVAVVVPVSASQLIGKSLLPLDKSGQVVVGQKVVVDFFSFPASQYGAVEGVVAAKSKIPTKKNMLPIEIRFPKGLVTNDGKKLEIGQDMRGDMMIIINEKRLIQWIADRF